MEKSASEKFRLGIFVLIGTALLVLVIYFIGNQQNMFGNSFTLKVSFKNIRGLQNGNNVRYAGISIGTVKYIEMINDTTIEVDMLIDAKMQKHIKKNAIANIGSDGLVGSMIINIVPGVGEAPYVESGDEINSFSGVATADMMNTLSVTNENAALLTEQLLHITRSINNGDGTLGRLLNDTLMGGDLKQTLVNLKQTSNDARTTMHKLNELVQHFNSKESVAGTLLGDSLSGAKIRNVLDNLENASVEIEGTAKNLNTIVDRINKGKGAINYLATDTTLVHQLQNSVKNVDEGLVKFNENMEALKHNFLTRGYFKKQEKQQEKNQKE
ncbi:MlaD family protein [Zobellia galactanivorans]|uniref:MlaD family protein n=1 Tax=Zobellia galactanivorans (strain DSM 12802 / CCUG 47099 / CIP 106680 / NCIMB 13871 / Dsij) TaxID=63186 RepID=UPI001C07E6A4|nr:MlaD family protein [Zobellia galactanivorans]MBU3024520.1 MCE family protein [Zobellia galactanivorans]MDO6807624.1 MlaD family protein [Zobellia galactanivorans]